MIQKGGIPMNKRQIELVQSSFERVKPMANLAGETFYKRFFEVAPQVRHIFRNDMKKQAAMFMSILGLAVGSLHDLDKIIPTIRALGERHTGYGTEFEHFNVFGECLLWTLEQVFGDEFTPELMEAWTAAYMTLADTMQEAMHGTSAS